MLNKDTIKCMLDCGIDLIYQELSACEINSRLYVTYKRGKSYQLHCDSHLFQFSEEYDNTEDCADKFLAIKNELDRRKKESARIAKSKKADTTVSKVSTEKKSTR